MLYLYSKILIKIIHSCKEKSSFKNTRICTFLGGSWEPLATGCEVWVESLQLFLGYGHSLSLRSPLQVALVVR